MSESSTPRPWRTRLTNLVRWHRRSLAAVAAGVAVLAGLNVVAPSEAHTVSVTVAARELPPGHHLVAADLTTADYPPHLVPDGSTVAPADLVGHVLIGPAPRGTPLGTAQVVDASRLPAGRMLVPVRVDDPAMMSLLRVGDLITVIGSDDSGAPLVLARRVRIAAVPASTEQGPLGGASSVGGMVVVDVDEATAVKLSAWSSNPGLSVSLG